MHADVTRYPSGFWNTSKIPMQRAFPSPRRSKKALKLRWIHDWFSLPPLLQMGTLTYISTISQLQKHLFCFSQPSACREGESGSLSAQQSGSAVLVQSMSRSTSPHHQHKCHVHFFQTLSAEAVSLTDSISACSRQAFDTPKLLTLSGQLLLTLSLLKGKRPKVSQFSSETDAEHTR